MVQYAVWVCMHGLYVHMYMYAVCTLLHGLRAHPAVCVCIHIYAHTYMQVCAPIPLFVGVLEAYMPAVRRMPLEDVIFVDLDQAHACVVLCVCMMHAPGGRGLSGVGPGAHACAYFVCGVHVYMYMYVCMCSL